MSSVRKEFALAGSLQARKMAVPSKRLHEVKVSRGETTSDLIERIYAAAEEPRLWADFLERLARTVRGTVTAMVCEDFRAGHPSLMAGARLDGVLSLAYKEYFSSRDASADAGRTGLRPGEVVTSQQMPSSPIPAKRSSTTPCCGN